ncbi:MAG: allantoinase AllB [Chthoniobacterales bacterium]|nr:allantoinase AllB [Chthoniobacterales bacterium]
MSFQVIIRNGSVVLPEGERIADIAIQDGTIAQISATIAGSASSEIDATDLHVLPGVIDSHVHFNEPGRADWEGIATGSLACAAGGTTCFIDMPLNASPPTLDAASFDLKLAAMLKSSCIDFGLWGGLTPENLDHLEALAERGVVGFKAFMSNSGIDDFACSDDATLRAGMKRSAALRLPVAVHAESEEITARLTASARQAGKRSIRDYLATRPIAAEVDAIRRACDIAGEMCCMLHIVHVSSAEGVRELSAARASGVDVTCETCPHYLLLTDDDVERIGATAKCAPPLRSREEVENLWSELRAENIDFVASDHSPAPASIKTSDDFFAVWGGIAGCQSLLPAMIAKGGSHLSLPRMAAITSTNVAARYALPRKGRIAVGSDADLSLIKADSTQSLRPEHLHYRHPMTPYLGSALHGIVRQTLVRGQVVIADNQRARRITPRFIKPARS